METSASSQNQEILDSSNKTLQVSEAFLSFKNQNCDL